ncbi:ComF family protein [Moraxella oculi]|uniref:ComF family protein n=1 Tax=Moraxella oculi TaxID=2940516 RepID=A0ABW8U6V9_9GAMM
MFHHRRRISLVRLPPYVFARWLQKIHGLCVLCREPKSFRQDSSVLCDACHAIMSLRLPPINLPILQTAKHSTQTRHFPLYAATFYQYPINQAMTHFKDKEHLPSLMILSHAIHQLPRPIGADANNTVIIPMPTTNKRLVKRGFDPVMVLAKILAHHWQLPLWRGLHRIDDGEHQRKLDRKERLDNMRGAFALIDTLPAKKVILFDDVATTGATLQSAAGTIIEHAPKSSLLAVCVAHGSQEFSWLGHLNEGVA